MPYTCFRHQVTWAECTFLYWQGETCGSTDITLVDGLPLAIDVTVVHALPLGEHRLVKPAPSRVMLAENQKFAHYSTIFDDLSVNFCPCGMDVFGTVVPQGLSFLTELGTRLNYGGGDQLEYSHFPLASRHF